MERLERKKKAGKQEEKTKESEQIAGQIFTRFWVLRESYVKKTGEGLGIALEGLDFSDIFQTCSKIIKYFLNIKS